MWPEFEQLFLKHWKYDSKILKVMGRRHPYNTVQLEKVSEYNLYEMDYCSFFLLHTWWQEI